VWRRSRNGWRIDRADAGSRLGAFAHLDGRSTTGQKAEVIVTADGVLIVASNVTPSHSR
jgi:hypothetical protein